MKKVLSNLLLIFQFPFRLLKKSRFDNFVAGLIFGAIFSLVVNITTVKIQEDINRQRALEALEREIVGHFLTTNNIIRDGDAAYDMDDSKQVFPTTIHFRYETRIYGSDVVTPYLFEVSPDVAGKIDVYYSYVIDRSNSILEKNEAAYDELNRSCSVEYRIIFGEKDINIPKCNQITRNVLTANTAFANLIYDDVLEIRKTFHPTQDRLDSWWLRLLLGNQAYEVMKVTDNSVEN